jgi:hypothetical protein
VNADLREDVLVEKRLEGAHLDPKYALALSGQGLDHIPFQTPKHQRFHLFVKLLDLGLMIGVIEVELVCKCNLDPLSVV